MNGSGRSRSSHSGSQLAHRTVESSDVGVSPSQSRGGKSRVRGRGTGDVRAVLPWSLLYTSMLRSLGLCILYLERDRTQPPYSRSLSPPPPRPQLMSALGVRNSTTCKANAGHHRSTESGAVKSGGRNERGLASSYGTVVDGDLLRCSRDRQHCLLLRFQGSAGTYTVEP